jgi:opacity protein-like surface antigen
MVGAGVDWAFRDDIWLGLEYTFSDFGKVKTSNGADTSSLTGLNYSTQHLSNKLRANSIALNFTYLINCI